MSLSISVSDLKALMDTDPQSFTEYLNNFGGIDGLFARLNTSPIHGLCDDAAVLHNRQVYRANALPALASMGQSQPQLPGLCSRVWSAWGQRDMVITRLAFYTRFFPWILALVLAFLCGYSYSDFEDEDDADVGWVDTVFTIILTIHPVVVLIIPLLLVTWANRIALANSVKFTLENAKNSTGVAVTRNGENVQELPLSELVAGDICNLSQSGSVIPADGILLADDSNQSHERLFAGEFHRCQGQGQDKMLVLAVGENTREFRTHSAVGIQTQKAHPVLDEQLYAFYVLAIKICLVLAAAVAVTLFLRFSTEKYAIEKQVWAMSHMRRFVSFILKGLSVFELALPEIIPPAMIFTQIINLKKAEKGGILFKNIGVLSTIARITVLVVDEDCAEYIKSIDGEFSVQNLCQRIGVKVVTSRLKAQIVESMKSSGEIVGYLAFGLQSDVQPFRGAHVGIILGSAHALATKDALESADALLPVPPSGGKYKKFLALLFSRGRGINSAVHSILQLRLPGLCVLCFAISTGVCLSNSPLTIQAEWILVVTATLILGFVYSQDEDEYNAHDDEIANLKPKPLKIKISPTLFPRNVLKNIICQSIYQTIIIAVFYCHYFFLSTDDDDYRPTQFFDTIVWMTLFNAINSRKWEGGCNVFSGISLRQPFVWIWILFAIFQIVMFEFGGLLSYGGKNLEFADWLVCVALGIGTLLVYQVSIRIPFWKEDKTNGVGAAYQIEETVV